MKSIIQLSAFLMIAATLCGCAVQAPAAFPCAIAEPVYPKMASYPNEEEFTDPVTGIFDEEGFYQCLEIWSEDQQKRAKSPDGYADHLREYFHRSIPAFLDCGSENGVCSPLNVYMALALLAEVTEHESQQQILELLGSDCIETLGIQARQIWNTHYCNDGASTCVLANSLWMDREHACNQEAVANLAKNYYASVFQGDLGSEEVNEQLRSWLNEQTGGLLEEQTQTISLDPQTVLALASTIYYRAKWSSEFRPENNTDGVFHSPAGDLDVTFMNRELSYGPYYRGEAFGAVSLRLEDGSKMWLVLPDEGRTPQDILAGGLAAELILGNWRETESQKQLRINLSLPKFDVGSDLRLEEALQQLGIIAVFDPENADFSPILPEHAAWLGTVNHAARVKIDEEGVEASAYTVMAAPGAAMPPKEEMDFILDRPFLFMITSRNDLPLFAGIVNNP